MERDNSTQFLMNSVIGLTAEQLREETVNIQAASVATRFMNEREKTREEKHWDRRGASRPPPPPPRSCGRSAGRTARTRAGAGRPLRARPRSPLQLLLPIRPPGQASFCGELSEKNARYIWALRAQAAQTTWAEGGLG